MRLREKRACREDNRVNKSSNAGMMREMVGALRGDDKYGVERGRERGSESGRRKSGEREIERIVGSRSKTLRG